MTINQRFERIILSLFSGNKSSFASAIGVTPSVVDNIVGKRQGKPSFEVLQKLSAIEEINIEWVVTGMGDMLKNLPSEKHLEISSMSRSTSIKKSALLGGEAFYDTIRKTSDAIPLVSEQAVGGLSGKNFVIQKNDVQAYYVIPKFKNLNVDFMIEMVGDSMMPRFFPGDVVACSIIYNSNFIQWNKPHLIATREQGLIVKRLRKSSDQNCILAVSDNKDYDPFDIPKDEITGMARIVGVIHVE
ncbi:S24 family peptidase [uncultured Duncaniella sp.]|uniref:S24 family peptidase n=1 Tax=uncultured Duncaniella sp. TaxID=2768039 RepID=UPI0025B6D892|nr:S24 family peptidase [uncultured Duncaniella sp.]